MAGIPRIDPVFGNPGGLTFGQGACSGRIDPEMNAGIRDEISRRQQEQPACGVKAATVLGMVRMEVMQPQVDEASGQLDQALVKGMVGMPPPLTEPEILKNIVGLVISTGVEALQIADDAGILPGCF